MLNIAQITGVMDFTPLVALITAVAGEVAVILGYFAKSGKENSSGGLVYDLAMSKAREAMNAEDDTPQTQEDDNIVG